MQGLADVWEASVTMSYRMTFQRAGDTFILRRVGTHDVLKAEMGE
jgi:mRNA-degrading endonuclease YafQ of YafQ-DinJ toxin-antitoxin module